jgi:hypothetical protein
MLQWHDDADLLPHHTTPSSGHNPSHSWYNPSSQTPVSYLASTTTSAPPSVWPRSVSATARDANADSQQAKVIVDASLRTRYKYAQYLIWRVYIFRALHYRNGGELAPGDLEGCREAFKVRRFLIPSFVTTALPSLRVHHYHGLALRLEPQPHIASHEG